MSSDRDLVAAAREGSEAAWELLVDRHGPLVIAAARQSGLTADAADDVYQETFLNLLRSLDRLNEPEHVRAWLVTTARRSALKSHRHRLRHPADSLSTALELEANGTNAEELIAALEQRQATQTAISGLSSRCKHLLELLYGPSPMSYTEISNELEIPVGSIGPTRARCLEKLRERIEEPQG